MKWCFWVYKIADNDPTGDYYLAVASVDWKTTYASYHNPPDNYGKIKLSSSVAAVNNVCFADPDHNIAPNTSCSSTVSFSVGVPSIAVGVSEKFCSGGKLNLESFTTKAAQWGSPDVTRTPHWEVAYLQKVPQGSKPLYTGSISFPRYTIQRNPTTLYWTYTKLNGGVTYSWQIR